MFPLARIVAPTDFSEAAFEAVKAAEELALHFSAELLLTHVVDPVPPMTAGAAVTHRSPVVFDIAGYEQLLREQAEDQVKELAAKLSPELRLRSTVEVGIAAEAIVRAAADQQADLIVIATRGRTGLSRLIFGSVAEKVVRTAECPVLTIRDSLTEGD